MVGCSDRPPLRSNDTAVENNETACAKITGLPLLFLLVIHILTKNPVKKWVFVGKKVLHVGRSG